MPSTAATACTPAGRPDSRRPESAFPLAAAPTLAPPPTSRERRSSAPRTAATGGTGPRSGSPRRAFVTLVVIEWLLAEGGGGASVPGTWTALDCRGFGAQAP